MSYAYLDASAIVKLIIDESESDALETWLADRATTSSSLVATETRRAARRSNIPDARASVEDVLGRVVLYSIDSRILDQAGRIGPPTLRTLDAIHLATALRLEPELEAFVTYDLRLAEAAEAVGLRVVAPA
ncbi:MAG: type II toxin-antitoxin system VapC family toxin [Thermoleophilia bacterium]|nr:type II toxin-antitoxin system VapC family toxin [Thermoleophilia bacterium]